MAAADNIGSTSRAITQRDFIRNICEFYSGTTLTDTQVDALAPGLIASSENLFTWPNGSSYEPLKCIPGPFKTNATGSTKPFWTAAKSALGDSRSVTFYCPQYGSAQYPFASTAAGSSALIVESSCTTCYDSTIRIVGDEMKAKVNITLAAGINISEYNTPKVYVQINKVADENTGDLIFSAVHTQNQKEYANGGELILFQSNKTLFANKPASTNISMIVNISGDVQPLNTTTGIPLTLSAVPTFTDQNGKTIRNSSASLSKRGPTSATSYYFNDEIKYDSNITWNAFPTLINISVALTKKGNKGNVYLHKLHGKKPKNYNEVTFTTGATNYGVNISVSLSDTSKNVKPKWGIGFDYINNNSGIPFGYNKAPFCPYVDDIGTGVYHIPKYASSVGLDSTYGEYPRYIIQVPYGCWIMPLSGTTSPTATTGTPSSTRTTGSTCYALEANLYIARQLKISGDGIQISGSTTTFGASTHDFLVPPVFYFKKTSPSATTKYVTATLYFTKPDGTTGSSLQIAKTKMPASGYRIFHWSDEYGGDYLELKFTTS